MGTIRALGLLLVCSISGCATPPPPLPPPTAAPPASPAPVSTPAVVTPAPSTKALSPEPDAEYSFDDFKGASGDCYHAVHCLAPPSTGPKVAAPAPHAACEATWHKVNLHPDFSGEQSKKKARVLCCYRTTVCEQPF